MLGGAAGGARSRPPSDLHQGVARFPLYSLFPTQGSTRPTLHKVTESLFSTSLSTFGVPTPPPNSPYSPLQLELLNCSQRVLVADKEHKMEEAKLGKGCLPESLCCPSDQRQIIDGLGVMQPLTIKTEQAKRSCNTCLTNSPKKVVHTDGGCSRTNPVTWLGVAGQNVQVQVKREPQHVLSELVAVKLEQASPGNKPDHPPSIPASLNNGSIPVGIAVARQRVGDAGLLAALSQKDNQQRMHDIGAASFCCRSADAAQAAMTVGVANVLCDDRPAPLAWPAPPPPAPPAPLWQYPTAQVSMESMMVGGVGVGGVGSVGGGVPSMGGYQLVREPTTGALLLLPAPPDLPHTVVWGGVPYPSAPLLLPPAPHPSHLQLLPGDLLASTATLQHTHTHSTRLVTLAPAPPPQPHPSHTDKKKIIQPLLTPHALIKIEPEPQEKPPPQFAPEPMQQPVMATHLYYQPDFTEQACRSQATSPAAPPTPPPDAHESPAHKDASNQTDHIDDDDDSPNHADEDERDIACVGVAHFPEETSTMMQTQTTILQPSMSTVAPIDSAEESSSECLANSAVVGAVEKAIDAIERDESLDNSSSGGSNDLVIDTGNISPVSQSLPAQGSSRSMVDVSGLELLSNSIEQFERTTPGTSMPSLEPGPLTIDTRTTSKLNILIKTSPKSPPRTAEPEQTRRFDFSSAEASTSERSKPSLDGLGLLCALAEQRFMEEVVESPASRSRPFIKSEPLLSPIERERSTEKKEKHRNRDGDSSSERRRKRSRDREERLRHKLEKMRRHKREREQDEGRGHGGELEASLRRITACSCGLSSCSHAPAVSSAQDLVNAMEKDMRERLQDLQRQCDEKRAQLNALTPPLPALSTPPTPSTPALSPDSDRGSSKKRKVGRPRKVSSPDSTETIVAKKPKSKSSIVGYLLAKGKLKGGILCSRGEPSREDGNRTSKVRPKLKAEPILKVRSEEDDHEWSLNRSASSSMESLNEVRQKNREKVDRLVRKHSRDDLPELEFAVRRGSGSSDRDKERRRAKKRRKSVKSKERNETAVVGTGSSEPVAAVSRCTLTEDKLDSSPRVLTAMGGLFYAGKLSAVQAPDVYAITLDGERGNKPHILSREETLRDAILEVSPSSVAELPSGSRICAYWSQQYRCLYPGTVAVSSPDPHDDKFVAVEFDDGDSGRIAIEDIRFLEPNYPVVEYENPLFTLGKRRRNTSVTDEKKVIPTTSAEVKSNTETTQKDQDEEDRHRDRKKLKKHRKEKMKRQSSEDDPAVDYVKKKKKKHKCCEDHCKHRRHHKKHHRKHRKRHHSSCKEQSSSSGDDNTRHKSSSDYIDSNKSNEDSVDSNDRLSTLIAVEKSPNEKMKTVIKKAVLSKKALVKNAMLDFSNLKKITRKKDMPKDNLKDSGIGLDEEPVASTSESVKKKTKKQRTVSSSSEGCGAGVSKMAAFLPGTALWRWRGPAYRRTTKPRFRKLFYRAIQRGEEVLHVGDAAVFLSTGRPDRPYIGCIESLFETRGAMTVRVKWFYHPEETTGLTAPLHYPGGLFDSPHTDENDVQTVSHKCEVLPLSQYKERMGDDQIKYNTVYDNNDVYYLAGHYDHIQQVLRMEPDIPFGTTS
ncbi:BAH and coiled-coil domain-containing protein 1 isoform X2 [Amyelois transitella]|uniref:BAH and coiled-coil domain-containing protein 1 isoform X2 n=1 Tax=Amyelois transitella TaxID=680683 RepID=UPI00298FC9FD|nr:BAH and coiled-coil domain-containing protein 1 isoform X2 [Amyelois transitella]